MIDSIVTFKWRPREGYRSHFKSEHVNTLRRSFARHYSKSHRFICITDDASDLDSEVEALPLWTTFNGLRNPTWPSGPNCYPRLLTFGKDFEQVAGKRFLCIDLDVVITRDVTPLIDRTEDFVIWGTGNARIPYCASMYLMTAGTHAEVLDRFDPCTSPRLSHAAGFFGSDQAWINFTLGRRIPTWTTADGVYSYRDHLVKRDVKSDRLMSKGARVVPGRVALPADARVVIFHGKPDPWDTAAMVASPWIREHTCQL